MRSVASGALINMATRIAAVVMGVGITLFTARLGAQHQGTFALFTAVESILLTLFSGLGISLARRVSHHGQRPTQVVGAIVVASILAGALGSVVLTGLSVFGPPAYSALWLLALAAPVLLLAPNLSGIWLGLGHMGVMAGITIGAPLLTLLGIGLAFAFDLKLDVGVVLWSWVIAKIVVAAAVTTTARRTGWIGTPKLKLLVPDVRFVAAIGLANLVSLMNYKVDLFLVQHFLGLSATGVYSVAVLVAELLWFVSASVTQAAYARIGTPDPAQASRMVVQVVHASLLALLLLAPVLWLAASQLLPSLLGDEYRLALPALAILLPGVLLFGAASALSAYFTNQLGRPLIPAAIAGLSLVINFVVSWLLIPRWGIVGGAIATSASYLLAILVAFWIFWRVSGTPLRALLFPDWQALRRGLRIGLTSAGATLPDRARR